MVLGDNIFYGHGFPEDLPAGLTLLAPGGAWMALKGQYPADEIAALPVDVEVFHVEQLQVPGVDAQRCIVWMRAKP